MNYLFVMPKMTQSDNEAYYFPIGVAYVSASLKDTGRNVFTLNLNYKKDVEKSIMMMINNFEIDVVAVGGLSREYHEIKEILDISKKTKPDIISIVGGGIITSDPVSAMKALEIADYGVVGEGEITICELADAIERNKSLSQVDGIVYRDEESWIITNSRREIDDLDMLPFPDYDGFEFSELLDKDMSMLFGEKMAYIISSRSCPYNCTFCFHPSGSKYRVRTIDNVFKEVDWLIDKYPQIKNFRLSDELFGVNNDYLKRFCAGMKERNLGFSVQMRVDIITREILETLKDSGCIDINFGLESADNRVLESMRKKITIQQIENALNLANEVGISTRGNFIFGDLEETLETATNTLNWWEQHQQYSIALTNIIVYPGSYLYKVAVDKGIIKDKVKYLKDGCPHINLSKMTDEEYIELMNKINSLCPEETYRLNEVKITYVGSGRVNIEAKCPFCKKPMQLNGLPVFTSFGNSVCANCGKGLRVLVSDYVNNMDNIVDINLKKLKQYSIGIWPMNNSLNNLYKISNTVMDDNIYIIDSSTMKQGTTFYGKRIYPPQIINLYSIDIVFISNVYVTGNNIREILKKEYPIVKNIFYLDDLIDPRLIDKIR